METTNRSEAFDNAVQVQVHELSKMAGYDLHVREWDVREVDHPKGNVLADEDGDAILDNNGNEQIVQVKQWQPKTGDHTNEWFYQSELFSLVILTETFHFLQLFRFSNVLSF